MIEVDLVAPILLTRSAMPMLKADDRIAAAQFNMKAPHPRAQRGLVGWRRQSGGKRVDQPVMDLFFLGDPPQCARRDGVRSCACGKQGKRT